MARVSSLLSRRLHSVDQHTGYDADVVRKHAPENLCVEVSPRLPFASKNIKSSLKVRYDGFDPASPFFESGFYVHTASHVLERSDDLIEHDIDDAAVLRQPLVPFAGNSRNASRQCPAC